MIEIRKATVKDIKDIVRFVKKIMIGEASHDHKISINYDATEQGKTQKFYKQIIEENYGLTVVALDDDKVVGFLNSYIIEKNNIFKYDVALINGIYADSKENEDKIYKALIAHFEKWCLEVNVKYTKVRLYNNDKLIKLYRKLGYSDLVLELEKKL